MLMLYKVPISFIVIVIELKIMLSFEERNYYVSTIAATRVRTSAIASRETRKTASQRKMNGIQAGYRCSHD